MAKIRRMLWFSVLIPMLIFCSMVHAREFRQTRTSAPVEIPMTTRAVNIDAVIGPEEWKDARVFQIGWETMPGENLPAAVKGEALVMYDRATLYVAFRCADLEPGAIRARYSDRDHIDQDDQVALEIDTFNDGRTAYVIGSNALGVQADWIYNGTDFDAGWDTIYDTAGAITDDGYVIEMAIPFSSLQFQRSEGVQTWGMHFWRAYPRSIYREMRSIRIDRNVDNFVGQFEKVTGFAGATPGRNIELTPTIVANYGAERPEFPREGFESTFDEVEPGLTARWGVTTNLNLLTTINPDFSQVEADALQLDINTPFALSYEEKRPFFTEGAGFFSMPVNAVYTRSIRDPRFGFKLTGKEGANNIGAFVVRDEVTNLIFPGADRSRGLSLDIESTTSVFRYNRDVWNNSTLGLLVTDRRGDDYANSVFGVDGFLRVTDVDSFQYQILGSNTRYPDAVARDFRQPEGDFSAHNIDIHYYHTARNLNIIGHFIDVSEDFRADAGFIPQVGYRKMAVAATYRWYAPPEQWWNWVLVGSTSHHYEKSDGELLVQDLIGYVQVNALLQSQSMIWARTRTESYNGREFDLNDLRLFTTLVPVGDLVVSSMLELGDQIDFANTRQGGFITSSNQLSLYAGRHLKLDVDYTFERMEVEDRHLYTANISTVAFNYHLNSRAFARAIVQYLDYRYNQDNYSFPVVESERQLMTQLLFSYKLNPRTVLFLGYADNYFNGPEFGLTRKDYTVFAKIGYALVL